MVAISLVCTFDSDLQRNSRRSAQKCRAFRGATGKLLIEKRAGKQSGVIQGLAATRKPNPFGIAGVALCQPPVAERDDQPRVCVRRQQCLLPAVA